MIPEYSEREELLGRVVALGLWAAVVVGSVTLFVWGF